MSRRTAWVLMAVVGAVALACTACERTTTPSSAGTKAQEAAATQREEAVRTIVDAYRQLPEELTRELAGGFRDEESDFADAAAIRKEAAESGTDVDYLLATIARAADQPPAGPMQGASVLAHMEPLRATAKLAMAHLMDATSDTERWCTALNNVLRVLKGQPSVVERSAGVKIAIEAIGIYGAMDVRDGGFCKFTAFGGETKDAMDVAGGIVLLKESYAAMIRRKDPYLKEVRGVDFDVVRRDSEGLALAVEASLDAIAKAWKTEEAPAVIDREAQNFPYASCRVFVTGFGRVHDAEIELRTRLEPETHAR
jgi:hypothetical protein